MTTGPYLAGGGTSIRRPWSCIAFAALILVTVQGCGTPEPQPWHSERLDQEFTASDRDEVRTLADYVALEDRLFTELQETVYAQVPTGPAYALSRYSSGSAADPTDDRPDWNRSFEMPSEQAAGGVLLLHGMSDSPYSLRTLAETLRRQGYWIVGLRLPGHGTAPSGLRYVEADDMSAAVRLAMTDLAEKLGERPIHVVGYSNGATLAIDYALAALEGEGPVPASMVLISPSIRIHPTAALASFKDTLSAVPGLGGLAWLQIQPEFDPYKYNSFATNAGDVVHRLTTSTSRRVAARAKTEAATVLPPTLVFKSTVDATVSTQAVVDNLLAHLKPNRHELVLFDINRSAAKESLIIADPAPLTDRLLKEPSMPFAVTLVTNKDPESREVVARYKPPLSPDFEEGEALPLNWPNGVVSLSHIALSFPPDDPLYGAQPPEKEGALFLGGVVMLGERGLLKIPDSWFLRMRYNPFYEYLEARTLEWFEGHSRASGQSQ